MATATRKRPSNNGKATPKLKKIKDREELLEVLSGCSLTFSWWGTLKMVPREQQEMAAKAIDADRKSIKTQKVKIDTDMPEWKELQALRSSITGWYNFRTFPYCVRGHRLFRREMREEIWEGVRQHQKDIDESAKRLQARRNDVIAWAKRTLGKAFDNKDYPDTFATSFSVQVREHAINPPDYLKTENFAEFNNAQRQAVRDIQIAMDRFEGQCAGRILTAVQKMNDVLKEGGSPRPQTLEVIQNAFERVARMKFTGTAAFEACKKDVQALMQGIDPKALRRMHSVREDAKEKFAALLKRHQELLQHAATTESDEE